MTTPLLILDCHYLCHRAWHSTGGLRHEGDGTGVLYGFLRDMITLQHDHSTSRMAFAFDYGVGIREQTTPTYKAKRRSAATKHPPEVLEALSDLRKQIVQLREEVLPELGYKNIFYADGFEADDIIASLCNTLAKEDKAIIISTDKDLYQLISEKVSMWNPVKKELLSKAAFLMQYGIHPGEWVHVKAMAGCGTDEVAGIKGVGELTACKYLRGELAPTSKAYNAIKAGMGLVKQNMRLVELPYLGTPKFELKEDKVSKTAWASITKRLGMKSLSMRLPGGMT